MHHIFHLTGVQSSANATYKGVQFHSDSCNGMNYQIRVEMIYCEIKKTQSNSPIQTD